MRRAVVAGNAKMNLTRAGLTRLLGELAGDLAGSPANAEVIFFPPYSLLPRAETVLTGTSLAWGAQNMHWEASGAYTGEISADMLLDTGGTHVILGHSERRHGMGETDRDVNRKTRAALEAGLVPVVCIGETEAEREAGATEVVLSRQLVGSLEDVRPQDPARLLVAYEPVWAIGTGKTATSDQAQAAHRHIRDELGKLLGTSAAEGVRILYGGSVNPGNAVTLLGLPDVDGALVGGACLKSETFLPIIRAADTGS